MSNEAYDAPSVGRTTLAAGAVAMVLAMGLAASTGMAQTQPAKEAPKAAQPAAPAAAPAAPAPAAKKDAPKAAAAAPAAAGAEGGEAAKSSWVKLCDKVGNVAKDKDGKETKTEKNVCATFHDTIDANTGMTVVSAAVREVEGDPKPDLQVTVPLGMIIPAGAKVSVLSNEQTEKLKKNEEVDPKDVKQADLKFTACLPNGCTAEIEAPQDMLDLMKKGGSLLVRAIYVNGQPFAVPVPLSGFDVALAGKPVDNEAYKKARGEMMQQIRQRQAEMVEKFKAEKMKELPPQPGTTGATGAAPAAAGAPAAKPAAPAPAEKK